MENNKQTTSAIKKGLHILFGIGLLICFFLPWVLWGDHVINAYDLPAGNFFSISASKFGLANPFPSLSFTFYIFWLIPVFIVIAIGLALKNSKSSFPAFIAGALSLALIAVFYLFTNTLIDLGIGNNVYEMLQLSAYVAVVAAIGFILTVLPAGQWPKKMLWVILGPILAFSAYKFGEKKVMAETYKATDNVKADFTISANDLLNEFISNDSLANAKYIEKIVVVNGNPSQVESKTDSITNIQFDHSEGSYIVFSFDKEQFDKVKDIKPGDPVSLKGSCSGSIYSEILGTTSISFKRAILINNKN